MLMPGKDGWSYKDISFEFSISHRAAQNFRRQFKLRPIGLYGSAFVFDPAAVRAAMEIKLNARLKSLGLT